MVAGAAVIVEEVERVVGIVVARVAEAVIAAGRAIRAEVEERGGAGVERGRRSREKEEMFDGGSRSRSRGRESLQQLVRAGEARLEVREVIKLGQL